MRTSRKLKIVEWIIKEGTSNSDDGSYLIGADDICELFNVTHDWLNTNCQVIASLLMERSEISNEGVWVEFDGHGFFSHFDCYFWLSKCPNYYGRLSCI